MATRLMKFSAGSGAPRISAADSASVREHGFEPALRLEQVERPGHASRRQQRRLHSALRDQRVGDRLRRRDGAFAHRDRSRRAHGAECNGVRELFRVQAEQPPRHCGRGEPRNADAVPRRVGCHQRLAAAVDFAADEDRGQKIAAARAGELGGGERHRNIVARMAAAGAAMGMRADHVIVEVEHANERAVGEHRVRRAHFRRPTEHGALRLVAERGQRRQHGAGALVIARRKTAADRVEKNEFGLLDRARRKLLAANA
jgi:hypothetical protein